MSKTTGPAKDDKHPKPADQSQTPDQAPSATGYSKGVSGRGKG